MRAAAAIFCLGLCLSAGVRAEDAAQTAAPAEMPTPVAQPTPPVPELIPPPVIVVFVADMPEHTESVWFKALQKDGEIRRQLADKVKEWRVVKIPQSPDLSAWSPTGCLYTAAKYGIKQLPAVVFLDSKDRLFHVMEGAAAEDELDAYADGLLKVATAVRPLTVVNDVPVGGNPEQEAEAICAAFADIPPAVWRRDYPGTVRRLRKLAPTHPAVKAADMAYFQLQEARQTVELIEKTNAATDEQTILECLKIWQTRANDETRPTAQRQQTLLIMVHPLWVKLEALYYHADGAHSGKSEDAFNKAIATLEQARDFDKNSSFGQHAHRLREELRAARLQAKKYD